MAETARAEDFVRAFGAVAEKMEENRDRLNELDGASGDGDHGTTVTRAWRMVVENKDELAGDEDDVGEVFVEAGRAMALRAGGSMGPLYGTFLLRAGRAARGQEEADAALLADMLEAGVEGVEERGRSREGERTMVDALAPAARAAREAVQDGAVLREVLAAAVEAAKGGVEATEEMRAMKGRAGQMGRAAGDRDAGAASSHLMLEAMAESLGGSGS